MLVHRLRHGVRNAPRAFLALAPLLLLTVMGPGKIAAQGPQPVAAGVSGRSDTQPQSPFSGSVPEEKATSGVLQLSLGDAVQRGLKHNLGAVLTDQSIQVARGQRLQELSRLVPNITTTTSENVSQAVLATRGIRVPGIPFVVGPFGYFDARANVSWNVFDWNAVQNTRAAGEGVRAAQATYKDARELVVTAVINSYLVAVAQGARVETADAQVKTAQALYQQALDREKAGTAAAIDVLRARVELQTRQQRLISARSDFAISKLTLGRVIGLAPGQQFELVDTAPYSPLIAFTPEEALERAYALRMDFQAAQARVRSSELQWKAARAEYLPTVTTHADYGDTGVTPGQSHGTVNASISVNIPIFQGGRVEGRVREAEALLKQEQARLEDLRGRIDFEIRSALLNVQSAWDQVQVAQSNVGLAEETLVQAQDRYAAGVTDNVEVVQAQEFVAQAHESLISSLYAFNLAKIQLARAIGFAETRGLEFIRGN